MILNLYWYKTLYFAQQDKMPIFINSLGNRWNYRQILSTPLIPTLFFIFFSFGKLPANCFRNYDNLPQAFIRDNSVNFAKIYNFFGLFIITPLLLISFFPLFTLNKLTKALKIFIISLYFCFFSGIIFTLKNHGFWGGPQYDVRYFYPYTILLIVPTTITIKIILSIKNKIYKTISLFLIIVTSTWSLFSGWMGVISMLKPVQTGERRIWIDLITFWTQYKNFKSEEYLNATFMNRENAWIAVVLSIIGYLFFRVLNHLIPNLHIKFYINRRKVRRHS